MRWLILLILLPATAWGINLQVIVQGINPELTEHVEADLTIEEAIQEPKLSADRIRNLYDLADSQIIETMQALGYYNSEIEKTLTHIDDNWVAKFIITPGKPTIIRNVSLITVGPGKDDPNLQRYLQTPELVPGSTIKQEDYENTKERLLVELNAQGYLRADFNQSVIEIDRNRNTADIKFIIDTGIVYKFGSVNFNSNIYSPYLLDRFVPFNYGNPYTIDKLIELQDNLETSDLFSKIRIDPQMNSANPNDIFVPLDVRLTVKPRNRFSGSVGYGTDTSFRGSLAWLHRFAPYGHKLFANISGSKVKNAARINYIIPGKQAANDQYIFGLVAQEEQFDDVYSRKAEIFGSFVISRKKWVSTYGINYFTETYHLTEGEQNSNRKFLLPNAHWIWTDEYQGRIFDYGSQLGLSIRAGAKSVGSEESVLQAQINGKHIVLITQQMRLLLRGNVGAVASNNFAELPPSLRYFTGGDNSVRGYKYNTLGAYSIADDPNSDVIGGKYLYVFSAEIEHQIYQELSGAIFFDAGNATDRFFNPFAMSPGVGLRYKTPIGNFRIDLAKPLNIVTNKHWVVNVNFGTDF